MREEPVDVARIPLRDFVADVWDYKDGEHVTILGPTGSGKTFLIFTLLARTATKARQAIVLQLKPRSATVDKFRTKMKYRLITQWPPLGSQYQSIAPNGWVLKPTQMGDPDKDNPHKRRVIRKALIDTYNSRQCYIIVADETVSLERDLKLTDVIEMILQMGREMNEGMWLASQRAAYITQWAYGGSQHLFLAHDSDVRSQERYSEIGGINPAWVVYVVRRLEKHEWLYIHKESKSLCIVTPE